MGSRDEAARRARGGSPSQLRTPPTHAGSNQKGWLALSWLSLPAPGTGEYGQGILFWRRGGPQKQNLPEPGAAKNLKEENSMPRKNRSTQEAGQAEVAKAWSSGQCPALLGLPVTA